MVDITGQPKWSPVRQLEKTDLATGGAGGVLNQQAQALFERTEYLKENSATKDDVASAYGGLYGFNTYAEFNAVKAIIPSNSVVKIAEANTGSGTWGQGENIWDGATLKKSPYDPVQIAKDDATLKANQAETNAKEFAEDSANEAETNAKNYATATSANAALAASSNIIKTDSSNLHELSDADGNIFAKANTQGELESENFRTEFGSLNSVTKTITKSDSKNLYEFSDSEGDFAAYLDPTGAHYAQDYTTEYASFNEIAFAISSLDMPGILRVFTDCDGNIIGLEKTDGTVENAFEPPTFGISEIRAGVASINKMNDLGLSIDKKITENDVPLKYSVTVSPYQADGTNHQRMPSAVKVGPNRLYVAFTQFSTMSTDQADGRLVGRFVDFDLVNKSATISATIPIIGEKLGNTYRHPHLIQLRDSILLIFNGAIGELFVYESFDNCETWQLKTMIDCPIDQPWALALDSAVLIEDGRYKGRIVLTLFRYQADGLVGTVYSDDGGATWIRGQNIYGAQLFPDYPIINETSIALDSQQNLICVIRNEGKTPESRYLIFAKSIDGGKTLQIFEQTLRTPAIACQTGLKQTAPLIYDGFPRMIATCPTTGDGNREGFRFRISYDNCMSWAHEYKPFPENLRVGYSTVIPLDPKTYALVYEEGTMNASQSIKILFLNLAEVI